MRKIYLVCFLLTCYGISCDIGPYEVGYCEVRYENIDDLPSQGIQVVITDRSLVTLTYKLSASENRITLPLEAGDSYRLRIDGIRADSVYNVLTMRSRNKKLEYYSFMFNNTLHDINSNKIRIDL
jgi:hypothetical protein